MTGCRGGAHQGSVAKHLGRGWSASSLLVFVAVCAVVSGTGRSAADFDAGDVAVLQADPTILQPGEDIDLAGRTITFTPMAGGGYTLSTTSGSIDPSLGFNLGLGDDASTGAQSLGFTFPFFGVNYTTVFVNSNGYVTFGGASSFINFNSSGATDLSTVLDRMAGGFPRIAALWNDLDPSAGGGVFFNALGDRLRITWNGVPRFSATIPNPNPPNTVQLTLFQSGVIQLTYGILGPLSTEPVFGGALVGLSPGSEDEFRVTTLDLSAGTGGSVSAFPNDEPLVQVFGTMSNPLVHVLAVARRFYQTHGDIFDQLVMFANFDNAMNGAFAFEIASRISMGGTGQGIFNNSSFYGSAGRLHSFLNMNKLSLYPADPTTRFLGTNSTLDVMGQETGHQWLAFLQFDDSGATSDLLLGRQLAHWSFFHDTNASDMEGNRFTDNGNGTFTTVEATARYSALDQYAMGLRPAAEVPDFFFVRSPNPSNPCGTADPIGGLACAPQVGVTVSGKRQNVSIAQVIGIEGLRPPGFSGANPTTTWHQAFILLVSAGTTPSSADMGKIDAIHAAWVPYFNTATDGRGVLDTALPMPILAAAVLPSSRSVQVGTPASAFATILNAGPGAGTGCGLALVTALPATFTYQTTDPMTNALTGTPNTPVDIPAGATQSFVFAVTPTAPVPPTDVQLSFDCTNTNPAPSTTGLNTLLLVASATPVPDIVALAATIGNTGIVTLASAGAFAVASVNVGAGGLITASADTGGVSLPQSLALCQTNPTTGQCTSAIGPSVTTQIEAGATPTFSVFVTGTGPIPFNPATNRIFVRFRDADGVTRGATSVAVRTQ